MAKFGAGRRHRTGYAHGPVKGHRNPRRVRVRKGKRRGAFDRSLAQLRRVLW